MAGDGALLRAKVPAGGEGRHATLLCGDCGGEAPHRGGRDGDPWINVTARREQADILAKARRGEGVLVSGAMYEREYNGQTYKGINASVVLLSQAGLPGGTSAAPSQPPAMTELEGEDGELPF